MIKRHGEQNDEQGKQQLPWASGHPGGGVGWGWPSLEWAAAMSPWGWIYLPLCLPMVVNIVPNSQTKAQLTKEWCPLPALFPVRGRLVVNPRPQAITIVGSSSSFLGPGIPRPHCTRIGAHTCTHTHTHTHRQFLANTPTQESEF